MLFAVRGYARNLQSFRLKHQVPEAGKFGDIVFDEGGENNEVFQLKYKEKEEKYKISGAQLFNETLNSNYNLLRYVKSFIDLKSNKTLEGKVKMAVVFTNIDFDLQKDSTNLSLMSNRKVWYQGLTHIRLDSFKPDKNTIFDTSNLFPHTKYYKFDKDPNIVDILKRQSEVLSNELRQKMQNEDERPYKQQQQNLKKENQRKIQRGDNEVLAKDLENLTEDNIREALQYIVYAVQQPNDRELEKLIKEEIKDYFKLQDAETVYNVLEKAITNWCNTKIIFNGQTFDNPHIIQFEDVEIFFQKYVKQVSFGEKIPTSSFIGRLNELTLIKKQLEENNNLVVSQSIAISGLGGIGKTELVKQFIKEFGQSDFYGRVIWIEAESDESVKKSFDVLAEKIGIQGRNNKSTITIIDEIFDYFHGLKVLFVFDNFDKHAEQYSDDEEKHFVIYCMRKRACDPTNKYRPYFIFTSRNQKCLPGMPSLDLSVLPEGDAHKLIRENLIANNYTNEDVEELAKTLQYFPLALQQAIVYINKQHEIENVLGGGYVIQNYLTEFEEKTKEFLNVPHMNNFGEHGQTTWITWNVTFDAISKDIINGPNAIKVLQYMSYLYADKIDAKMFLPLFTNDSRRTIEAFLLLKKYSIITNIGGSNFYQIHRLVQRVVQLKLKEQEHAILKQAWELIFPKLYINYFDENQYLYIISQLIEECTMEQILHYNSLATSIKNYEELNIKFLEFLRRLSGKVLLAASEQDDVDKIIKLPMSQEEFKDFAERKYSSIIKNHSNKVFKYFVKNGYLGSRYYDSILLNTISYRNLDLFKYMIENGAYLKDLVLVSSDLIYDIIQGKADSLLDYIKNKEPEDNVRILKESLFFATLFDQKSIVELLIFNEVAPNYVFCEQEGAQKRLTFGPVEGSRIFYGPITAAATLKYPNILQTLLKTFDTPEFKKEVAKILFDLLDEKYVSDKDCFEIALKKYLELGGKINDEHKYKRESFLCYATQPGRFEVGKIEIVNILLDNDGYPCLMNAEGDNALFNVLIKINDSPYYLRDKAYRGFYDIYSKMGSKISTEELMSSIRKYLFKKILLSSNVKMSDFLFSEIDDINLRNQKKETLLIYFIREFNSSDDDERECDDEDKTNTHKSMVEFLCDKGVDVDAKDNDGKDALYYSLNLELPQIFSYLLTKVRSISKNILLKAIKDDKLLCFEQLLKSHFKLNHTFMDGKTIIEIAFEDLSLKIMLLLHRKIKELNLEKKEVDRIYKMGKLALIKYIKNCVKNEDDFNYEDLEAFLEISTDINAIDSHGKNALYYAKYLEDNNTYEYLLSKSNIE